MKSLATALGFGIIFYGLVMAVFDAGHERISKRVAEKSTPVRVTQKRVVKTAAQRVALIPPSALWVKASPRTALPGLERTLDPFRERFIDHPHLLVLA